MMLLTLQQRYQLCHLSLPNLTEMPVICTANSNFLKQKLNLHLRELIKIILVMQKLVVLNWLGDAAFEIYGNFIWTTTADKDDPLKVLKAFEDYF